RKRCTFFSSRKNRARRIWRSFSARPWRMSKTRKRTPTSTIWSFRRSTSRKGRVRSACSRRRWVVLTACKSGSRTSRFTFPTKSKRSTSVAAAQKAALAPGNNGGYLGSEGQSLRIPARFQQDVAFPLVRREDVCGDAASRFEAARRSQEASEPRRRVGNRHRAHGEQDAHQHLHLASRHHHRT